VLQNLNIFKLQKAFWCVQSTDLFLPLIELLAFRDLQSNAEAWRKTLPPSATLGMADVSGARRVLLLLEGSNSAHPRRSSRKRFDPLTSSWTRWMKGDVHHNYGCFLYFCVVQLGAESLVMAKVSLVKALDAETICPRAPLFDVHYELPRVDTSSLVRGRIFVMLRHIRGKVMLAPPDSRLALPASTRLTGPCFVLNCANCVV